MSDTPHRDDDDDYDTDEQGTGEHGTGEHGSDEHDSDEVARAVFAGLAPRQVHAAASDTRGERADSDGTRHRIAKSLYATVPIVLVGSMAVAMNIPTTIESAQVKRPAQPKAENSEAVLATVPRSAAPARAVFGAAHVAAAVPPQSAVAATQAPRIYRVLAGDTVSDIAMRFGLSTPSVLALNGLSWTSLIFPGQQLTLSTTAMPADVTHQNQDNAESSAKRDGAYTIVAGDTISAIAERFGVSTISVLLANGLGWSSIIYPGQTIVVPGATAPSDSPVIDQRESPVVLRDDSAAGSNLVGRPLTGQTPAGQTPTGRTPSTSAPVDVPAGPVTETQEPSAQPTPPAESAPPAPPAPQNGSYVIVSGDTISAIASRFGITTQALLDANGLSWSSVIYGGQNLVIPGVTTPPPSPPAGVQSVAGLTDDMAGHARTIIQVGRELGVPDYGIVIALATAMQESSLRNLDWGDRDSVGLFQQRPSSGWGSVEQLTTPTHAARLFYGGPSNPNRGYTRGLLDIRGWESMALTQAAQAVQISGHPDAYAKWEQSARSWFAQLG